MNNINTFLYRLTFFAALLLPVLYFTSLMHGIYIAGDTVSFLQYATAVSKLQFWDVFLIHGNQWPPLPAIFYNMLQILPGGFITEQKAYLLIFFTLNLLACYFLAKKYAGNFTGRIIITSLLLFSGIQTFLLRVSLADVQFMAAWLWALVFLDRFIQTKKEKYVALFIIPASLIPMTRYAGLPITLALSVFLLVFSAINYKRAKFSIYFIISASLFTLLPISLYLFRNLIATHVLTGFYDPQFQGTTLLQVTTPRIRLIASDIALSLLIALLLGTRLIWRKDYLIRIFLFTFPIIIYLSVVIIQQLRYRVTEFIPSRYTSPFYPIILLTGLLIGSWLSSKLPILKKAPKISIIFITFLFFVTIYHSSIKYFISEFGTSTYRVPETAYSQDIQKFCNFLPHRTKYLFLQYDSRNWVAQGLYFFCQPIIWVTMNADRITLPKDSIIFSPYELTRPGLKKVTTYYGVKDVNLFLVESAFELNIKKELAKLGSILQ